MTEQELREKLRNSANEMKPIVEQMTHILMDAYEKGVFVGIEIGKNFTITDEK